MMNNVHGNKVVSFPNAPGQKDRQQFLRRMTSWTQSTYSVSARYVENFEIESDLASILQNEAPAHRNDEWFLPIIDDELVGSLVISPYSKLNAEERNELCEILDCTAIPFLKNLYTSARLKAAEQRMVENVDQANIVSFYKKGQEEVEPSSWDWTKATTDVKSLPIMLEGTDLENLTRAAMEIHERSTRVAFLRFQDIDPEERRSVAKIKELDGLSIFIENLEKLNSDEINVLKEYLAEQSDFEEGPAFLIGFHGQRESFCEKYGLSEKDFGLFARIQVNLRALTDETSIAQFIVQMLRYSQ